jgi:hypothetical protein
MLEFLLQWENWRRTITTGEGVWRVVSVFIRDNRIEKMTLKLIDRPIYRQATRDEIEQIVRGQ